MQTAHSRLVLFAVAAWAISFASGCTPARNTQVTQTGLQFETVKLGAGPAAQAGQTVRIHETMSLADGKVIADTRAAGSPVTFVLGGGQVIDGVDQTVTGMMVGERRRVIVPPELSKRTEYPANIPPEATLFYDIELIEIVGTATP